MEAISSHRALVDLSGSARRIIVADGAPVAAAVLIRGEVAAHSAATAPRRGLADCRVDEAEVAWRPGCGSGRGRRRHTISRLGSHLEREAQRSCGAGGREAGRSGFSPRRSIGTRK
jgi:hypothetical protein